MHNALKVSEYRTPQNPRTFRSSSQNLLSGQLKFIVKLLPCHAMANLQHNGKKWYCKKWNFWKNQLKGFSSFKYTIQNECLKNTILSFSMTLLCLLTQLWGWNFHFSLVLKLNFWGVPSTFQGIVPSLVIRSNCSNDIENHKFTGKKSTNPISKWWQKISRSPTGLRSSPVLTSSSWPKTNSSAMLIKFLQAGLIHRRSGSAGDLRIRIK